MPAKHGRRRARTAREQGHGTVEYLGLAMLLGGIVVAVVGVVPASVAQAFNRAVCVVTTEECPGGTPRDRVPGLAKTEAEVAPESRAFAQSQAQHRAEQPTLREDVRRRVVDAGNGTGGTRSSRTNMPLPEDTPRQVRTMLSASPEKFSQLVQRETIYSDAPGWFGVSQYNWRYFRSDPGAGDGIVVFDFFIETGTSGHIIRGDDRGFPEDSGALSVPMHMSRFRVVIDRSTGRGVIIQSKSTGNDWLHGILQNEPQPIAINEDGTIKNYQLPNHYKVHADENSITLEYKGRQQHHAWPGRSWDDQDTPGRTWQLGSGAAIG